MKINHKQSATTIICNNNNNRNPLMHAKVQIFFCVVYSPSH